MRYHPAMWLIYALGAAILWGVNYAVSGRLLERGLSPFTLFLLDLVFGIVTIGGYILVTGKSRNIPSEVRGLGSNWPMLLVVMVCATAAGLLSFVAIGLKMPPSPHSSKSPTPFLSPRLHGSSSARCS